MGAPSEQIGINGSTLTPKVLLLTTEYGSILVNYEYMSES